MGAYSHRTLSRMSSIWSRAACVLLALGALYVLSFGPFCRSTVDWCPASPAPRLDWYGCGYTFYRPLQEVWAGRLGALPSNVLGGYISFWIGN
jgi:hypothetical protein